MGKSRLNEYALGLLVALNEEFDELKTVFTAREPPVKGVNGGYYRVLEAEIGSKSRLIVVRVMEDMGQTAAAQQTQAMLGDFAVPLLVSIGIAGSLSRECRLGDVVIAETVDDYEDTAKRGPEGIEYAGSVWTPTWRIIDYINTFRQLSPYKSWRQRMAEHVPPCTGELREFVGRTPEARVLPIASGNSVMASREDVRDLLMRRNRKLAAIEMESGGLARTAACRPHPVDFVILKGISDFADERKSLLDSGSKGAWRRYAVRNASQLLAELLRGDVVLDTQDVTTGTKFADTRDRLTRLAADFESLRASMESSRERSYELNRLLAPVRALARGLPLSAYDVAGALADRAGEGERIVAVAVARSLDNPMVVFDPMLNALENPKSRYEQTHVLRYFEDVADVLDKEQRNRLDIAMTAMHVNETSDRGLLRELVKRRMRGLS